MIRVTGIVLNIVLNLLLIVVFPALYRGGDATWLPESLQTAHIGMIFLANIASSALILLLLFPQVKHFRFRIDRPLLKKILIYGFPILIAGTAGIINETMDRVFLMYLLPKDIADTSIGIYGACYKMAIFITLFIQAFRLGAEPFFFSHAREKDAPKTYARIMTYFVAAMSVVYLGITANMEWLQYFIGENYRVGLPVVPIILMGNIFLGIYFNLSIWYKLSDRTAWGAYISIIGAAVTIAINFAFVPRFGYIAAAWATFAAYGAMMLVSLFAGQKYYPVPYKTGKIAIYLGTAAGLSWLCSDVLNGNLIAGNAVFVLYIIIALRAEAGSIKSFMPGRR